MHRSGIVIHHSGHLLSARQLENKKARYSKLARAKLSRQPQDPAARFEMAVQLVNEGQANLACRLLQRVVIESPQHEQSYQARLLWAKLLGGEQKYRAALDLG